MQTKAIEFISKGKAGFCELGEPTALGPNQILLETRYTGVTNGTERHALNHEHGFGGGCFPSKHGYQHVSEIIEVGSNVKNFEAGDWVYYGAYVGHRGWNIVDENSLMIKLPDSVDRKFCALFGVAGVALRSIRRLGVRLGDNVLVAGQGPIGNFTTQAALAAGAHVVVTDTLDERLKIAKQCGAHVVLNACDDKSKKALTEEGPYNFIYDCCSAPQLLTDIHVNKWLAFGGTVGMMAVCDQVHYPWSLLHGLQAKIETSCHFTNDDLRVLLFLYEQNKIDIKSLVTHFVPVDDAKEMYEKLSQKSENLMGIIFDWTV